MESSAYPVIQKVSKSVYVSTGFSMETEVRYVSENGRVVSADNVYLDYER